MGNTCTRMCFTSCVDVRREERETELRVKFRSDFEIEQLEPFTNAAGNPTNHAHPVAALVRAEASRSMEKFLRDNGRSRFDLSAAKRDIRGGRGSRMVYDLSDVNAEFRYDAASRDDVVTMVDVDYYVDKSTFSRNAIIAFTSAPQDVAGKNADTYYYYTSDGLLHEHAGGGAKYTNAVWDYNSVDKFVVKDWFSFTVCNVEKVPMPRNADRSIVGIFPDHTIHMPFWLFSLLGRLLVGGVNMGGVGELQRVQHLQREGDFVVAYLVVDGIRHVSIRLESACDGESFRVPYSVFIACKLQYAAHPKTFGVTFVETFLKNEKVFGETTPPRYVHMLTACITGNRVADDSAAKCSYQTYPSDSRALACDEGKAYAHQAAEAIVEKTAVAPVDSVNNDISCVQGRIEAVANEKDPPREYYQYRHEFVGLLVGAQANEGVPISAEDVYAHQRGPMQVARNAEHQQVGLRKQKIKSFQKKEAYGKINDPRNISTCATAHTVELSRFVYSFKDGVLKDKKFYMPGKTPRETAEYIRDFVKMTREARREVVETDYSRFDGTISPFLRKIEFLALKRWVRPEYKKEIERLCRDEVNQKAKTRHGIGYFTKCTRLSGSPLTTSGNTTVNAFIVYCALRKKYPELKPEECFARIGPKFGDDGLDEDLPFEEVCKDLGLKIKIDRRRTYVTFCGRVYINPEVSLTSFTAPSRCLPKIPIVTNGTPNGLRDKVAGYLITESRVPLVGDYLGALNAVYKLRENGVVDPSKITDHDLAHRFAMGPYPFDNDDEQAVLEFIAKDMGIGRDALDNMILSLRTATTEAQLLACKIPNGLAENAIGHGVRVGPRRD